MIATWFIFFSSEKKYRFLLGIKTLSCLFLKDFSLWFQIRTGKCVLPNSLWPGIRVTWSNEESRTNDQKESFPFSSVTVLSCPHTASGGESIVPEEPRVAWGQVTGSFSSAACVWLSLWRHELSKTFGILLWRSFLGRRIKGSHGSSLLFFLLFQLHLMREEMPFSHPELSGLCWLFPLSVCFGGLLFRTAPAVAGSEEPWAKETALLQKPRLARLHSPCIPGGPRA